MIHWEHVAYANIVEEEPRSELNAIWSKKKAFWIA